jgi:uncharacterized membrane protein
MVAAVKSEPGRAFRLGDLFRTRLSGSVVAMFGALLAGQVLGFFLLGTGREGRALSECLLVLDSFLALACAWSAFNRAKGITALFWLLFAVDCVRTTNREWQPHRSIGRAARVFRSAPH